MKSIKEKRILVKWARAMNETIDPALVEEVERYDQLQREISESIKSNTFKDLLGAAQGVKLSAESINIPAPAQVIKIEYPKPPSIYELELLLQEVQDELVQTQATEESPATETVSPTEKNTASEVQTDSIIERTLKHITQEVKNESQSYQQPDPALPGRSIDDLRKKIKYLEAWISKISLTEGGGGAGWLYDLSDVNYSSVKSAANGHILQFDSTSNTWISAPNTGSIGSNYGDSNVALLGYATNANVALKANVADLKTANVVELTNLYFTNARVYANVTHRLANIDTNVIPSISDVYNLGSPLYRFKDLYLSGNTIYLGNTTISSSPNGLTVSSTTGNVWSGLYTANVIETFNNLYFTNARSIAALTAGQSITIDANGRINSTATGGPSNYGDSNVVIALTVQTLSNATFSGNVTI